ncbi:MAG: hypothetical protein E6G68_00515, partial [Actinobacteria bacterium]
MQPVVLDVDRFPFLLKEARVGVRRAGRARRVERAIDQPPDIGRHHRRAEPTRLVRPGQGSARERAEAGATLVRAPPRGGIVDFDLTPEQELVRKTARDFADREIAPVAMRYDRAEEFPWPVLEKMKPLGFLGASIPEAYGGMGLDPISYCLVIEEIARADSSIRGILSVNCSLVGTAIVKYGTEDQKQGWLPRLSAGEAIGCFALTEPGAGSDPGSLRMTAVRDGDSFVLNGSKMFITNGTVAGLALTFANAEPSKGAKGVTAFLVPCDGEGFKATEIKGKLGLRAA